MNKVFEDYGIEIFEESGKHYIKFDDGELVSHYATIEVSFEDALLAQKSAIDADGVILKHQNMAMGLV